MILWIYGTGWGRRGINGILFIKGFAWFISGSFFNLNRNG